MSEQIRAIRRVADFGLELMGKKEKRYLALSLAAQVLLSFMDLLGVLILGVLSSRILNDYLGLANSNSGTLASVQRVFHLENLKVMQMASLVVAIFVLKAILSLTLSWRIYALLAKRANSVSNSLLDDFLETPFVWVRKMDDQTLPFAFMEGINALSIGVLANLILLASDLAMVTVLFLGLIQMSIIATLFSVLLFGSLTYLLIRFIAPRIRHIGRLGASLSIEGRASILDIKELFQEFPNREKARFFELKAREIRRRSSDNYAREQWLTGLPKNVLETAGIIGIFLILLLASITGTTQSNIGLVTVFLGGTSRVVPALLRMQANWLTINRNIGYVDEAMPVLERIRATTRTESRFQQSEDRDKEMRFRSGGLSFTNVEFCYPDADRNTIQGVSFTVEPGEKIAIVGDSGAGKTTLANLILGLFIPTLGKIDYEYSNKPVFDVSFSETGYLPQKPYIFSGSILSNVCLTDDDSTIDLRRFHMATQQAQIFDFVQSLTNQERTIAGFGGISLSGGERQRIALARVLYLNPSVIVLDEPTSSLDSETDDFVSRTLTSPELQSTVFVVAHKYSTVRSVNRILYLEDGKVLAFGTWEEIIKNVPRFALQAKLQGLE